MADQELKKGYKAYYTRVQTVHSPFPCVVGSRAEALEWAANKADSLDQEHWDDASGDPVSFRLKEVELNIVQVVIGLNLNSYEPIPDITPYLDRLGLEYDRQLTYEGNPEQDLLIVYRDKEDEWGPYEVEALEVMCDLKYIWNWVVVECTETLPSHFSSHAAFKNWQIKGGR